MEIFHQIFVLQHFRKISECLQMTFGSDGETREQVDESLKRCSYTLKKKRNKGQLWPNGVSVNQREGGGTIKQQRAEVPKV